MRLLINLFLLAISFLTFSCKTNSRKSFSISIEYSSPWAYPTKYNLTQNSIIVNGTEKRSDRHTKDVYKRLLTQAESDSIYNFLKSISYDTLKDSYQNPNFYDGTGIIIKINGQQLKSKKVLVYMCSTHMTDTLQNLMQRQVLNNKYKYENLCKDQ
ncbi:hypothetical protein FRZ67_16235 [Panacibacter ginsenosidivorans]|uniref:Lipoprotein n=1 Tax=Panacibacter ginsenosidivorans TaxID=1813871 RepID=A0A5B8VER7_9BACT|nr:hypothetical protein [Panacibacter ginsenosidivorans]QEC68778.1 hypothetical protein FRZ67_16235 [Panacibacter ginsenosidivorans]